MAPKGRKCPDLKINAVFVEIKSPQNPVHEKKTGNNIRLAHEQADHVIIYLNSYYGVTRLKGIAKGRFIIHPSLKVIELQWRAVTMYLAGGM